MSFSGDLNDIPYVSTNDIKLKTIQERARQRDGVERKHQETSPSSRHA